MWVLAATTGMRRSELAGAVRDLVNLDIQTLTKADTRIVVGGQAEESDGKTESSNHTISLDASTVGYLISPCSTSKAKRSESSTTTEVGSSATPTLHPAPRDHHPPVHPPG
jgi:hypothetical protein